MPVPATLNFSCRGRYRFGTLGVGAGADYTQPAPNVSVLVPVSASHVRVPVVAPNVLVQVPVTPNQHLRFR